MSSNKRRKIAEDKAEEPKHITENNPLISDKTTHTVRLRRAQFIHMRDYIRSKPNQLIKCINKIERLESERRLAIYSIELQNAFEKCLQDVVNMRQLLTTPYCLGESYRSECPAGTNLVAAGNAERLFYKDFRDLKAHVETIKIGKNAANIFAAEQNRWDSSETKLLENNLNVTQEFFAANKDIRWNAEALQKMLDFVDNPPAGIINWPVRSLADEEQNEDIQLPLDELEVKILDNLDNLEVIHHFSHNTNLTVDFVMKFMPYNFWDLPDLGANVAFNKRDIDIICQRTITMLNIGEYVPVSPEDNNFVSLGFEENLIRKSLAEGFCANPNLTAADLGNEYSLFGIMTNRFLWDRNYFEHRFTVDVEQRRSNLNEHLKDCLPNIMLREIERYVNYC